jgi:hypothetical protein
MVDENRRNGGRKGKEIAKAGRGSALSKGQRDALLSERVDTKGK